MNLEHKIEKLIEENFHKYYQIRARYNIQKVRAKQVSNLLKVSQAMRFECKVIIDSNEGKSVKNLFVKKHYLSEIEFQRLMKLWRFLGNARGYTIPRALDFIDKENLIILERIKGEQFLTYLLKNLLPFVRQFQEDKIQQRMRQVAKWLTLFQQKTYEGERKKLEGEIPMIKECFKKIPWFRETQKTHVLNVIKDAIACSPEIPITACHGCLAPRNIVVTEKGLTVLDFKPKSITENATCFDNMQTDLFREHHLFDVHYFIYSVISLHRFPCISGAFCKKLSATFLSEYKRLTQFDISSEAFAITRLIFQVKYLCDRFRSDGPKDIVQQLVPAIDKKWRREVVDDIWRSIKIITH